MLSVILIALVGHASAAGWTSGDDLSTVWPYFFDYDTVDSTAWGGLYAGCNDVAALASSPINMEAQTWESGSSFDLFDTSAVSKAGLEGQTSAYMQNYGHSIATTFGTDWEVTMPTQTELNAIMLTKTNVFKLAFVLWKWGSDKWYGAEHTPSGSYTTSTTATDRPVIEAQFHFYDSTQCTSGSGFTAWVKCTSAGDANVNTATAVTKQNFMVISVPFKATSSGYNSNVQKFIPYFGTVRAYNTNAYNNQKYQLPSSVIGTSKTFDLTNLFPSKVSNTFQTYWGQLTVPPCSQAAWLVTSKVNTMSLGQASSIRTGVYNSRSKRVTSNNRPTQPAGTETKKAYKTVG